MSNTVSTALRRYVVQPAIVALALPCALRAQGDRASAPRSGRADATGARVIEISNGSGRLVVEGKPGLTSVNVTATAYASSSQDLERIQLRVERSGDVVRVEPNEERSRFGWGGCSCWMDITVRVPAGTPLDIHDGSGGAQLRDVGAVTARSGSGGITIERAGSVDVSSGSGRVRASTIRGDVKASTGSGRVTLEHVAGSVTIEHSGSGGIDMSDVGRDVRVGSIGSGSVSANGVGGDLTVDHVGSGGVRYASVRGRVSVPSRWRSGEN